MKLSTAAILLAAANIVSNESSNVNAFSSNSRISTLVHSYGALNTYGNKGKLNFSSCTSKLLVAASSAEDTEVSSLDYQTVKNLSFRELQRECKERGLTAVGSTGALRSRLLEHFGIEERKTNGVVSSVPASIVDGEELKAEGIFFSDESDPDFEFKSLLSEIMEKSSVGHWKAATRKLKKLRKRLATPEMPVPLEAYIATLEACAADRLHGARASEPARKIIEEMADYGYDIPADLGNKCVASCLGTGPNGTHDGFGGIDPALAMMAAIESTSRGSEIITADTYGAVVTALSRDGAIDEAILLLRAMVVEHSFTPPLSTFSDVADAAAKHGEKGEMVLQVMTLAKAAGYILDNIASAETGRSLLASGVIAAEQMDNLALGLRLLTAAAKAQGCLPDRGDDLVAASSSAAQRASTLIHKRAIDKAIADDNWRLAVKLLELMPQRSLTPSASVMRKVTSNCAKLSKSRKATAILLDWVNLANEGKIEKPPLNVFNTVVNTCEICGEEELTLLVLESMKKTHETDGNIVTFNIALKRLAKLGNVLACEGIIIGMLQAGVEPNVVSYTTAIGACVKAEDSAYAYEWLKRMRSRNVNPNFHTYNTALAACLDGKLESTVRGSTIATEMMADVNRELIEGFKGSADYNSVIPDKYTKVLSRSLMKQLRENWRNDEINMQVAKATVRVPLLKLVDFDKSEAAAKIEKKREEEKSKKNALRDEDDVEDAENTEADVDFSAVNMLHKDSRRTMEI